MLIRVNAIIAIVSVVWMGLRYFLKKRYSHQSIYIWETMYWFFVLLLYPLLYILEKIQDSYLLKSFKKVTGESFAVYFPASSISSVRKVTESEYLLQISENLEQIFQILSLLGLVAFLLFSFGIILFCGFNISFSKGKWNYPVMKRSCLMRAKNAEKIIYKIF